MIFWLGDIKKDLLGIESQSKYTIIIIILILFSQNVYNKIYGKNKNKSFQDFVKETYSHVSY
jgi:hypothetical protein